MMYGENNGTDETWKRIPEGSVGIEIGVWKGNSSVKFLRRAQKLHLVDPWSPIAYEDSEEFGDYATYLNRYKKIVGSDKPKDFQLFYDNTYKATLDRINRELKKYFVEQNVTKEVVIHRQTSEEFFKTFNEKVDWVYVDGSHAYDLVLADLECSLEIIKHGGSIFGDDYSDKKPEVKRAVDDFCVFLGSCGVAPNFKVFGSRDPTRTLRHRQKWPDNQYEIKV